MYVIYYNYRVIHISNLIVVVLFKLFAYMYVIYYNYRVIHISHLIVVVLFKLFAKTEKITMEEVRCFSLDVFNGLKMCSLQRTF
jgi:hypothetical protein